MSPPVGNRAVIAPAHGSCRACALRHHGHRNPAPHTCGVIHRSVAHAVTFEDPPTRTSTIARRVIHIVFAALIKLRAGDPLRL
jgi:hypothetical protein